MATYPGVQDKLAAELEGAGLLATPSMPEPRDVDFNVIHELPVLDAVSPSRSPLFRQVTSALTSGPLDHALRGEPVGGLLSILAKGCRTLRCIPLSSRYPMSR